MYAGVMGCGTAEETGMGFVCFVVINPPILGFFFFISYLFLLNPSLIGLDAVGAFIGITFPDVKSVSCLFVYLGMFS